MELEEKYIQSVTYADVARALSRDFFRVFCVNTATNVYVEYMPHESDESLDIRKRGEDFSQEVASLVADAYGEDFDMVRTAFTKNNVLRVLSEDDSFVLNYRMMVKGTPTYVKLKAVRVRPRETDHILLALSNTDAHMQRLAMYERAEQNSITYASVAEALSVDYECIFYVDSITSAFTVYKSSETYRGFGLGDKGEDFFEACQEEFWKYVYIEDKDTFKSFMNRENLLKVLSSDRIFSLTFRIVVKEKPVYIRLKVTKMLEGDDHHLVVGISNVDANMQRVAEYQKMKDLALRDSMTGVKSKHAYSVEEGRINLDIQNNPSLAFAICVCDVNGLKQINDTLGHKAGDEHIMNASRIICDVYKHSPVFRIGGDEFAVVLRGRDYENRSELLASVNSLVERNRDEGGVVISVGMAEYRQGVDLDLASVFQRADERMYVRKKELKGLRCDER